LEKLLHPELILGCLNRNKGKLQHLNRRQSRRRLPQLLRDRWRD
jgi:hypothetical protein